MYAEKEKSQIYKINIDILHNFEGCAPALMLTQQVAGRSGLGPVNK
jgi:hypothetical protein